MGRDGEEGNDKAHYQLARQDTGTTARLCLPGSAGVGGDRLGWGLVLSGCEKVCRRKTECRLFKFEPFFVREHFMQEFLFMLSLGFVGFLNISKKDK